MNDSFIATRDLAGYREVQAALLTPDRYGLSLETAEAIRRLFKVSTKGLVSILHGGRRLTVSWSPFEGVAQGGDSLYAVEIDRK